MPDRLLLISSLLLVVLTVIFSQFIDAERFWQGHAVDIEVKMIEKGLTDEEKKLLDEKHAEFDGIHDKQRIYGRIFAGLMSFLLFVTVICSPIGVWKELLALQVNDEPHPHLAYPSRGGEISQTPETFV